MGFEVDYTPRSVTIRIAFPLHWDLPDAITIDTAASRARQAPRARSPASEQERKTYSVRRPGSVMR
jgi:hypothetical protein